jgi:hypothetical protein
MSRAIEFVPERNTRAGKLRRAWVERILDLAKHLDAPDRLLIEQVYRYGRPTAELAQLTGTNTRTMQRKVAQLILRMRRRDYQFVAYQGDLLPRHVRPVARHVILEGRSLRDAASLSNLTLHQVRDFRLVTQTLAEAY